MTPVLLFLAATAQAPAAPACPPDVNAQATTCRALDHQAGNRPAEAAAEFERLAGLLPATDPTRDRALAAAGNMWIAAAQPGKAAHALDRALAGTGLRVEQRGLALLDRARAAEAQNDLAAARARVTEAQATIAEDPFLWYFSAALAIREGDAKTAESAIARALAMEPNDPVILFQAGHVAHFAGKPAHARTYWTRARTADANGSIGKLAAEALALLDKPAAPK